jgi:DUF971 family protein
MRPVDIQVIGQELAIRWSDGQESYLPLEMLRRNCPCAGCQGEVDALGYRHQGPRAAYSSASFCLRRLDRVGAYAIQPVWGDGHATGIYSFDYLTRLSAPSDAGQ